MKKICFIFMCLFPYYLAAMYHNFLLLVFCGTEFLMFIWSFFLPRFSVKRMHLSFPKKREVTHMGCVLPCFIRVEHKGRILAGRFVVYLGVSYVNDEEEIVVEIPGECERGERDLTFRIRLPECGLLRIRIKSVQVFDCFSFCSAKKVEMEEMWVAVFPPEYALRIEMSGKKRNESVCMGDGLFGCFGNPCDEILQIREYREGDTIRHIHWNMSAKTDEIWSREYETEIDDIAYLMIEPAGFYETSTEELNDFYMLLYALVQGLLKHVAQIHLYWFDACQKRWDMTTIDQGAQCKEVLCRFYHLRSQETELTDWDEIPEKGVPLGVSFFRLDVNLSWFWNQTRIYQFKTQNLEQEIQNQVFWL